MQLPHLSQGPVHQGRQNGANLFAGQFLTIQGALGEWHAGIPPEMALRRILVITK